MASNKYHFEDHWEVPFPIEQVWDVLSQTRELDDGPRPAPNRGVHVQAFKDLKLVDWSSLLSLPCGGSLRLNDHKKQIVELTNNRDMLAAHVDGASVSAHCRDLPTCSFEFADRGV